MSLQVPTVHVRRDQHHLAWDNSIPPIATVESGSIVTIDALDAGNGQLTASSTLEDLVNLDFSRVDQVNGPIAVEGAEVGDTLEVEIVDLQPADWGWTANIPGFGLLADDFPDAALKIWKLDGNAGEFNPGIEIPLAPFCGEMGVAPAEPGAFSTIPPGLHGGNMDTKHLTAGSKLYLPVLAPDALFSLGDGHAAQGDGEVCGTAIETPMQVTIRLTARKDLQVTAPEFQTPGPLAARTNTGPFYACDGVGPDLHAAARDAVRRMIDYLGRQWRLDPVTSYLLCSVAMDLKISEIVDAPNWVVTAYMPLSIFK
jgi:acetamidase/formamidase